MSRFSLTRLLAATWARSLEFLRDRSALGWNLAFPILMVGGFAVIFSGPPQPLFKVAVIAPPAVALDAQLHPFLATPHIRFYRETAPAAVELKVARHRVDLGLDLSQTPTRYWVNPESQKGVLAERLLSTSGPMPQVQAVSGAPIRYVDWVVPGVLGMNLMFSCLWGIGYVIVRYRKSGYLKRLNATPLTALEFICAQLLSRLALVLLVVVIMYAGCNAFLHFRMEGSYLDLFIVTVIGGVAMTAMGLVIASRVTSEELAGGLLNVFSWPMMVLSGVFFSLDGAPDIVRLAADAFPLTHLLAAARAVMLDGAGLTDLAYPLLMLGGMAALFLSWGALSFRWTQD
jgi:ABC-2 type transport system permease protein